MNSETNAFVRGVQQSIEASGGLQTYRKHVLQHLQLKAVIKVRWHQNPAAVSVHLHHQLSVQESHCSPVQQLEFHPTLLNLFATVGDNQVG